MNKFTALLKSRKFWAALVGLGLVVAKAFDPAFPIPEEDLTRIVYVIVAYILGTGLEDFGKLGQAALPLNVKG